MAAPAGNKNAYRHGLRSNQTSDPSVNNQLRAFRRTIRQEIAGVGGSLTVAQEAMIQSLCRWEARALLGGHYLRREPGLPIERRMELLNMITAATEARDKVLRQLGIDLEDGKQNAITAFYASTAYKPPGSFSNAPGAEPAPSIDPAVQTPPRAGEKQEQPIPPPAAPTEITQ